MTCMRVTMCTRKLEDGGVNSQVTKLCAEIIGALSRTRLVAITNRFLKVRPPTELASRRVARITPPLSSSRSCYLYSNNRTQKAVA